LTMLNTEDSNILSWLRKTQDGQSVLVVCNFTSHPQTAAFDLSQQGVTGKQLKTLLITPESAEPDALTAIKLPSYGVYIGQVQ
jgi:alpha-glucosidase